MEQLFEVVAEDTGQASDTNSKRLLRLESANGITLYRVLDSRAERTSVFTHKVCTTGGLSTEDMQKFLEMPEDVRTYLKNRYRDTHQIADIIDIGIQTSGKLFKLHIDEGQKPNVEKPYTNGELEKVFQDSCKGIRMPISSGFTHRLGED